MTIVTGSLRGFLGQEQVGEEGDRTPLPLKWVPGGVKSSALTASRNEQTDRGVRSIKLNSAEPKVPTIRDDENIMRRQAGPKRRVFFASVRHTDCLVDVGQSTLQRLQASLNEGSRRIFEG